MGNRLQRLMQEKHEALLQRWFEYAIAAYPAESHKYFAKVKNEFTNPVGSNIYQSMSRLLTELAGERDAERLYGDLEMILKIRAVQDMKPSQALAFLPVLKNLVRTELEEEIGAGHISAEELADLDSDIDTLMLLAFDLYSESREQIYNLRISEIKATNDILERANLLNQAVEDGTFMRCSNDIEREEGKEEK